MLFAAMKRRHKTVCYTVGRPDITQQTCYTTKTASAEQTPDGRRYRPKWEAGMSDMITQIETQDTVDLHRSAHTHVGKPNTTTKNHIWRQRQQQTEAYNFGVEFGLEAHTAGEKNPHSFRWVQPPHKATAFQQDQLRDDASTESGNPARVRNGDKVGESTSQT